PHTLRASPLLIRAAACPPSPLLMLWWCLGLLRMQPRVVERQVASREPRLAAWRGHTQRPESGELIADLNDSNAP
ncbi:MAG: hypothetical protein KA185_15850, partial [Vitreoscilla sp.]|nr:hypothetical protein [Vitreoscilla sp.]